MAEDRLGSLVLLLYTDGITEASSDAGDMLGADRLMDIARNLPIEPPATMANSFLTTTREFRGRARRDDGQSVMTLRHWDA